MWFWLLLSLVLVGLILFLWDKLSTPAPWKPYGKSILITGGSSGIGKAVATELVSQGANVTILSRTLSKLKEAKKEIKKARKEPSKQRVRIIAADVSKGEALIKTVQDHIEKFGAFDCLITSAGQTGPQYFDDIPLAAYENLMQINYLGTVASVKAVLPSMKSRKSGKIVFISSMAGQMGIFGYCSYAPTKFALRGLADCLYHELLPYNIGVSLSYPPDTDTPMFEEENKIKPIETKLLSESSGVLSAQAVATSLIDGLVHHRYHIYHSLEGRAVAICTTGMSPSEGVLNTVLETAALPILRLVAVFTQWNFGRIIRKVAGQKETQKKSK